MVYLPVNIGYICHDHDRHVGQLCHVPRIIAHAKFYNKLCCSDPGETSLWTFCSYAGSYCNSGLMPLQRSKEEGQRSYQLMS